MTRHWKENAVDLSKWVLSRLEERKAEEPAANGKQSAKGPSKQWEKMLDAAPVSGNGKKKGKGGRNGNFPLKTALSRKTAPSERNSENDIVDTASNGRSSNEKSKDKVTTTAPRSDTYEKAEGEQPPRKKSPTAPSRQGIPLTLVNVAATTTVVEPKVESSSIDVMAKKSRKKKRSTKTEQNDEEDELDIFENHPSVILKKAQDESFQKQQNKVRLERERKEQEEAEKKSRAEEVRAAKIASSECTSLEASMTGTMGQSNMPAALYAQAQMNESTEFVTPKKAMQSPTTQPVQPSTRQKSSMAGPGSPQLDLFLDDFWEECRASQPALKLNSSKHLPLWLRQEYRYNNGTGDHGGRSFNKHDHERDGEGQVPTTAGGLNPPRRMRSGKGKTWTVCIENLPEAESASVLAQDLQSALVDPVKRKILEAEGDASARMGPFVYLDNWESDMLVARVDLFSEDACERFVAKFDMFLFRGKYLRLGLMAIFEEGGVGGGGHSSNVNGSLGVRDNLVVGNFSGVE